MSASRIASRSSRARSTLPFHEAGERSLGMFEFGICSHGRAGVECRSCESTCTNAIIAKIGKRRRDNVVELRRYQRAQIDVPVEFVAKGSRERFAGRAKDLSIGGMYVEAVRALSFGVELVVYVQLPGQKGPLALPAVVRWARAGGMGLQFGLLGARETHAITELTKGP
jgi:type IV pilus assembly protein PilZ